MEEFFCNNCGRGFNRKYHLERHHQKKNICKANKSQLVQNSPKNSKNEELGDMGSIKGITQTNTSMINVDTEKNNDDKNIFEEDLYENNNEYNNNKSIILCSEIKNNQTVSCAYCLGIFANKSNLNKHIRNNCKIKKLQDAEKENIFKKLLEQEYVIKKKDEQINKLLNQNDVLINKISVLEEKVEKISKNSPNGISKKNKSTIISGSSNSNNSNAYNTTNNTNTNTNTNSNNVVFNLVNYGKEDLDKIDIKYFINNVVKNNKAYGVKIPELI